MARRSRSRRGWRAPGSAVTAAAPPSASCPTAASTSSGREGRGARVVGPNTTAFLVALDAGVSVVGARMRPGAAPALLGVDAAALRDGSVALADVWGDDAGRLEQRLERCAEQRIEVLLAALGAVPASRRRARPARSRGGRAPARARRPRRRARARARRQRAPAAPPLRGRGRLRPEAPGARAAPRARARRGARRRGARAGRGRRGLRRPGALRARLPRAGRRAAVGARLSRRARVGDLTASVSYKTPPPGARACTAMSLTSCRRSRTSARRSRASSSAWTSAASRTCAGATARSSSSASARSTPAPRPVPARHVRRRRRLRQRRAAAAVVGVQPRAQGARPWLTAPDRCCWAG